MNSRPRGLCPVCRSEKALTGRGRIWAHRWINSRGDLVEPLCPGTGQTPGIFA